MKRDGTTIIVQEEGPMAFSLYLATPWKRNLQSDKVQIRERICVQRGYRRRPKLSTSAWS